ncbi:MAG: 50S ribosomal protein L17 [Thermodesulfobacteriota bacterium]
MRHNKDDKRFSRDGGHLRCMMSNMTNSLILNGRIKTTTPKAKLLRRYVERMITLGKSGSLPARRRAMAFLRDKTMVTRLFSEIAPRYAERNGGYTRIMKTGFRAGDCASVSIIELVEADSDKAATPSRSRRVAGSRRKPAAARKAAPADKTKAVAGKKKEAGTKKAAATTKKAATAKKAEGETKKAPSKKAATTKKAAEPKAPAKKAAPKKAAEPKAPAKKAAPKKAAPAKKTDKEG